MEKMKLFGHQLDKTVKVYGGMKPHGKREIGKQNDEKIEKNN